MARNEVNLGCAIFIWYWAILCSLFLTMESRIIVVLCSSLRMMVRETFIG